MTRFRIIVTFAQYLFSKFVRYAHLLLCSRIVKLTFPVWLSIKLLFFSKEARIPEKIHGHISKQFAIPTGRTRWRLVSEDGGIGRELLFFDSTGLGNVVFRRKNRIA